MFILCQRSAGGQMTPPLALPQVMDCTALFPSYLMLDQADRVYHLGSHYVVPSGGDLGF